MADAVPVNVASLVTRNWQAAIRRDQHGRPTKDPGNAAIILTNNDVWRGALAYDEFNDRCYWASKAPVVPGLSQPIVGERFKDSHYLYVSHWFANHEGQSFAKTAVMDAMVAAAQANTHHPLQDYLDALVWDGTERLSTWLATYLRCQDTDYTRRVGRWWLISAVARALRPGCQVDHMLVLEGPQGRRKSTALRILGGDWYLGSLPSLRDEQKAAEAIQGKWICEAGELDALRGAVATRTKNWITQLIDTYRPAYGRFPVDRPRSVVFAGTTNEHNYLNDPTGGRRYWPVGVGVIDAIALTEDRDQLWAEAVEAFRRGEHWWPDLEHQPMIESEQEERHDVDAWEQRVRAWTNKHTDKDFTTGDVLGFALDIEPAKWDRASQMRVGAVLRRLGFGNHRKRVDQNVLRVWRSAGSDPSGTGSVTS